jgi:hypothetical protein
MKTGFTLLIFIIFCLVCNCAYSQENPAIRDSIHEPWTTDSLAGNGFDFFASEDMLQMTLTFNVDELLKTKSDPEYMEATLTVKINETDSLSQHIKVKARGIMRRNYCSFPPIMLKFTHKDNESEPIQSNGNLKLVTQCIQSSAFESYIFKEYLAYRLYNLVTPYSFRTRLVRINYVDINKPKVSYTAYGFLIENADKMAERNNAVIIDNPNVTQNQMNSLDMARVAVFNYMIGNTDWSVTMQHNIKILTSLSVLSGKGIPVAYDFDYSGFVNTVYSAPSHDLPIESVTERYYKGICYDDEELNPVIDEFGGLKDKFLNTIHDFEFLSTTDKKQEESYINSFYKRFSYQNILINDLNRTCSRL